MAAVNKGVYLDLDEKELIDLLRKLESLRSKFSEQEIRRALASIVRPLVATARREAPRIKGKKNTNTDKEAIDKASRFHNKTRGIKKRLGKAPITVPGQLKASMGVFYPRRSLNNVVTRVYVGPAFGRNARKGKDGWFGHFIEFGTSRGINPNPYMLRAWMQQKNMIANSIVKDIDSKIASFRKHGVR